MCNRLDVDAGTRAILSTVTRPTAFHDARDRFTREYLLRVLAKHQWNLTHAASEVGVDRPYLYKLLGRYQIKRP